MKSSVFAENKEHRQLNWNQERRQESFIGHINHLSQGTNQELSGTGSAQTSSSHHLFELQFVKTPNLLAANAKHNAKTGLLVLFIIKALQNVRSLALSAMTIECEQFILVLHFTSTMFGPWNSDANRNNPSGLSFFKIVTLAVIWRERERGAGGKEGVGRETDVSLWILFSK